MVEESPCAVIRPQASSAEVSDRSSFSVRWLCSHLYTLSSTSYGYDANGNTTRVNGSPSYQYDLYTRLTVTGGATDYVSPEGQRLRKTGGSTGTTYFAPDTSGALMAEDDNGTWVDYVRLNGRLIGRISGGQVSAIHADQVGRPQVVTDASQNVVWLAQNFAFTQKVTTANITLNLGFPGQYFDAERQTWNNGYRDYVSSQGRYLESDPSGLAGGINTYAYVNGNPISSIDLAGLARNIISGIPANSVQYFSNSAGVSFYAPPGANYSAVFNAGQNAGMFQYSAKRSALAQGGMFDYQRDNNNNEFLSYVNASNYSVGVFMEAAGYSVAEMIAVGQLYAFINSGNFGDPNMLAWWEFGYFDAENKELAKPCGN